MNDPRPIDPVLIQSYVRRAFFVSTILRQSSAALAPDVWYYETVAWEWDKETMERGKQIDQADSGYSAYGALNHHAHICALLAEKVDPPHG